jgi:hypothetical protein
VKRIVLLSLACLVSIAQTVDGSDLKEKRVEYADQFTGGGFRIQGAEFFAQTAGDNRDGLMIFIKSKKNGSIRRWTMGMVNAIKDHQLALSEFGLSSAAQKEVIKFGAKALYCNSKRWDDLGFKRIVFLHAMRNSEIARPWTIIDGVRYDYFYGYQWRSIREFGNN